MVSCSWQLMSMFLIVCICCLVLCNGYTTNQISTAETLSPFTQTLDHVYPNPSPPTVASTSTTTNDCTRPVTSKASKHSPLPRVHPPLFAPNVDSDVKTPSLSAILVILALAISLILSLKPNRFAHPTQKTAITIPRHANPKPSP